MKKLALMLLLLAVSACAPQKAIVSQSAKKQDCPNAYVYAPGNFIIDIAGGAEVILNPFVHDFPVYCTPEQARNAVNAKIAGGEIPSGDWRIYRLDGRFDDLAQDTGQNSFQLRRMANIVEWISEITEEIPSQPIRNDSRH